MFREIIRDSFLIGIFAGIVISAIAYYTFINFEIIMGSAGTLRIKLYPPRLQLIILALSLILFRFMIVRWNMIKTGQGLFLTLFFVTIIYFFNYRYKIF
ncbi:MAG: hypothetical protein ABIT08_16085 [Bacteroidia bacterium]